MVDINNKVANALLVLRGRYDTPDADSGAACLPYHLDTHLPDSVTIIPSNMAVSLYKPFIYI